MAEIVPIPTAAELAMLARDYIDTVRSDIAGPLADLFPIVLDDDAGPWDADAWRCCGEFARCREDAPLDVHEGLAQLAGRLAARTVRECLAAVVAVPVADFRACWPGPAVPWSDADHSAPLADLKVAYFSANKVDWDRRVAANRLERRYDFGADATVLIGEDDVRKLALNRNPSDLGRVMPPDARELPAGDVVKIVNDAITVGLPRLALLGGGRFVEVGEVYSFDGPPSPAESGPTHKFLDWLPTGTVVYLARPLDGSSVGRVVLGRNANRPDGSPGLNAATKWSDRGPTGVHLGANFRVIIDHPGAVAAFQV